jgi:glycosyltransferase 2 family protein
MAVSVWTLYIRAQRWRLFLKPLGVPHLRVLFAATNIGFMANMLLPLRIGEVVRPVIVNRREGLPLSGLLATVLLERIFDMFTILLLFGVSVLLVPVSARAMTWGGMLTGLALGVAACIGLLRWQEALALRLIRRLCDLLPDAAGEGVFGFANGFVGALETIGSPADFARAFAWSLFLWLVIGSVNALALLAFHLPVSSALIVTAIVAIAVSVPSAPGYVGSFQLGCVVALQIYSVSRSEALAFSLVLHVTQFVATVAAGLYSLWTQNLTLREVETVQDGNGTDA